MSQVKGLNLLQKLNTFQRIQFIHTQPKKRFYKNVSVVQSNGQFEINLDHRKLKTPMGTPLLVINESALKNLCEYWCNECCRYLVRPWPMLLPTSGYHRRRLSIFTRCILMVKSPGSWVNLSKYFSIQVCATQCWIIQEE